MMTHSDNSYFAIIFPCKNPPDFFPSLVRRLAEENRNSEIILVNDNSLLGITKLFSELKNIKNVKILESQVTLGKGGAIKMGLRYLKDFKGPFQFYLIADCDGQHSHNDISYLIRKASQGSNAFHIGARELGKNTPIKRAFGRVISNFLFQKLTGFNILDSQCGLRILPQSMVDSVLTIDANNMSFEFEMLFLVLRQKNKVYQHKIENIYFAENISNYKYFSDTVSILGVFLRYFLIRVVR